jgi:hypothetical protein
MALNTFQVTDKIINIAIAFENIKTMKVYDGLWVYFDMRNSGSSHAMAWEDTKLVMNWAIKKNMWQPVSKNNQELENQFSVLFDKWGPHVSINGVDKDYKEKIKEGLRNDLSFAFQKYNLNQDQKKENKIQKNAQLIIKKIQENAERIANTTIYLTKQTQKIIQNQFVQLNTNSKKIQSNDLETQTAISIQLQNDINESLKEIEQTDDEERIEEETEKISQAIIEEVKKDPSEFNESTGTQITEEEMQEVFDQLTEKIDILSQKVQEIIEENHQKTKKVINKEIPQAEKEVEEEIQLTQVENSTTTNQKIEFCELQYNTNPNQTVIFNEIAWMGTTQSSYDEWIELKNTSNETINLKGWQIINKEENIQFVIEKDLFIEENELILLERTDDNSVLKVQANATYTGAIHNSNEAIFLFDNKCNLQDKVVALFDWEEGNNSSKRTMERNINLVWQTSKIINGTPKSQNKQPTLLSQLRKNLHFSIS